VRAAVLDTETGHALAQATLFEEVFLQSEKLLVY
jgi:hypothetical protein